MKKPTDDEIMDAVMEWGNQSMTYVVANRLGAKGFDMNTAWCLRQLKRLRANGKVWNPHTMYRKQLSWALEREELIKRQAAKKT